MKKYTNKSLLTLSMGALTIGALTFSSCSKQEAGVGNPAQSVGTNQLSQQSAQDFLNNMPEIRVKVGKHGFVLPRPSRDGFSFADSKPGYNFGSSSTIEIVTDGNGGYKWVLSSDGGSANAGGTVVAGNSSLDIGLAFCFTEDKDASGFLFGPAKDSAQTTGVSTVVGIAGDFESLANGEVAEDADITDYFTGMAIYMVYDGHASGSYEVLDWTNLDDDTKDKAVSMVFDLKNGKGYISSSGSLNVNSNSIGFSGNYYEFPFSFEKDAENEKGFGGEVTGFGTMGCM